MENAFQDLDDWLATREMPNGKRKVIKAALILFSKQGYDGTSTAQIAETSGMSQATIFKYFKSKDDLLIFIIEPIIEHLLPEYGKDFVDQLQSADDSLEGLLHFVINNRYNFLVQNKDAAIILFSQILINDQVKNMLLKKLEDLKDIFLNQIWSKLKATKEMRDDVDVLSLIRLMASQMVFFFLQSQRIGHITDEAEIQRNLDQIEQLVLRAIRK